VSSGKGPGIAGALELGGFLQGMGGRRPPGRRKGVQPAILGAAGNKNLERRMGCFLEPCC